MSQRSRRRIGLLTPGITHADNSLLWQGVMDFALESDTDLVTFYCGTLASPCQSSVWDDAVLDGLDGLITWTTGLLQDYAHAEEFFARFGSLPMTSIGVKVPGVPAVLVDNYGAQRAMVEHIIRDCGRRHIVFLAGPEGNPDAASRFQAYVDTLAAHDLPLLSQYIIPGTFHIDGRMVAEQAVRDLIERDIHFDAAVAASDDMAVGFSIGLERCGLRIPEDVAVAGFNDGEEGRTTSPALSSVNQNFYGQGREACKLLFSLMEGRLESDVLMCNYTPIFRQSTKLLAKPVDKCKESEAENVLPRNVTVPISGAAMSSLQELQIGRDMETFGRIVFELHDIDAIVAQLHTTLPLFGVRRAGITVGYTPDMTSDDGELLLAYDEDGSFADQFPETVGIGVSELVEQLLTRYDGAQSLVVVPLPPASSHLGIAVLTVGSRLGILYGQLALRIGHALRGALLFRHLQNYTVDLEETVAARTADLARTNLQLEQTMRLKDEFLANISHELRTPLHNMLARAEALLANAYGEVNKRQKLAISGIDTSGRHLLQLINDVLDVSMIEAG